RSANCRTIPRCLLCSPTDTPRLPRWAALVVSGSLLISVEITRSMPPELLPSMAVDLLRGNRLELPWLGGKVVALGRELGVPTPTRHHVCQWGASLKSVTGPNRPTTRRH